MLEVCTVELCQSPWAIMSCSWTLLSNANVAPDRLIKTTAIEGNISKNQNFLKSIPHMGVNDLIMWVKVCGKQRGCWREISRSQKELQGPYWAEEVVFDSWKLDPMMGLVILKNFRPFQEVSSWVSKY